MKSSESTIRNIIIDAAIDEFSSGDFEQATVRSIAEKAQVPTTTIYKYFKNKDDLYITIISLVVDRTNRDLSAGLAGLSGTRNKILQIARFQLEFFESNPKIACLIFASTNISYWYQHKKALEKARESSSVLVNIIQQGQHNKEVRKDVNLHVIVHLFFGALRAMVVSWVYGSQSYRLSDMSDYFADAIYSAVMSGKTTSTPLICPFIGETSGAANNITRWNH
jgi:AcrR family transcriptional regulator